MFRFAADPKQDQRDGTRRSFDALESGLLDQKSGNEPVDDSQDRREQLGMGRGEPRAAEWETRGPTAAPALGG